jgi:hypothetical protein
MKVSYHAAERFLERVMDKKDYSGSDINKAFSYLEMVFKDIVPSSYAKSFPLPGFKHFKVIHIGGTVVTIVPKAA